jgi:hypothetical protein
METGGKNDRTVYFNCSYMASGDSMGDGCMALARAKWAERAQAIKRVNDLSPKKMRFSFNILKTD